MDYDLGVISSADTGAPPPGLDMDFDPQDFNLCYQFPMMSHDNDILGLRADEELGLDAASFMYMPEFIPSDISPSEIPLYV
jgi:hypothetical protein